MTMTKLKTLIELITISLAVRAGIFCLYFVSGKIRIKFIKAVLILYCSH